MQHPKKKNWSSFYFFLEAVFKFMLVAIALQEGKL